MSVQSTTNWPEGHTPSEYPAYVHEVHGDWVIGTEYCYIPPEDMPYFLTGSRAYGMPDAESDYDVVVYSTDRALHDALTALSTDPKTIRIGQVNFILVNTVTDYARWAEGTRICMSLAPVTREFARQIFVGLGLGGPKPHGPITFSKVTATTASWGMTLNSTKSVPKPNSGMSFFVAEQKLSWDKEFKMQFGLPNYAKHIKLPPQKVKTPTVMKFHKYSYGKKGG